MSRVRVRRRESARERGVIENRLKEGGGRSEERGRVSTLPNPSATAASPVSSPMRTFTFEFETLRLSVSVLSRRSSSGDALPAPLAVAYSRTILHRHTEDTLDGL